jgi:hypothetical protein
MKGFNMIKNIALIIILAFLGLTQSVHAQTTARKPICSKSIIKAVGKHFDISNFSYFQDGKHTSGSSAGVINSGACKPWPNDNAITIATFAYNDKNIEVGQSDLEGKSLVIAMIDSTKNKILASYKGKQSGFGVAQDGLQLDTARYNLASGVRAFGINETEQYNPNCGDGSLGPSLSLFVRSGSTIKPVLNNFYSYYTRTKGRCVMGKDEEVIEETERSISIGKAITNGYANLLITEFTTTWEGKEPKKKSSQVELHFDGEKYVPAALPKKP